MSATAITIEYSGLTGLVNPANGQPVSGYITLQATQEAPGASVTVVAAPVTIPVVDGVVNGAYYTNGQANLQVQVTEQITGAANPPPYVVGLPTSGTLDLGTASRSTPAAAPAALFLPASLVNALGDLVIGESAGVAGRLPVGSNGRVLTADSTQPLGLGWEVSAGGFTPIIQQRSISSGATTPVNTSGNWQQVIGADSAPFENAISASVGNWVSCWVSQWLINDSTNTFYDIGVMVGTSIVRYLSALESTPATPLAQGDPALYNAGGGFSGHGGGAKGFSVTSGDLDGGNVRFALVVKSAGSGYIDATTVYSFKWTTRNDGPHQ